MEIVSSEGVISAVCQMFPSSSALQEHGRLILFVPFEVGWDHLTLILASKLEQKLCHFKN